MPLYINISKKKLNNAVHLIDNSFNIINTNEITDSRLRNIFYVPTESQFPVNRKENQTETISCDANQ
jgi:hypothetical protein